LGDLSPHVKDADAVRVVIGLLDVRGMGGVLNGDKAADGQDEQRKGWQRVGHRSLEEGVAM